MRRALLVMAICVLIVGASEATEYSYTTYDQPFPLYTQLTSENHQVNSQGHIVAPATFDVSPWSGQLFQGFSIYDGTSYTYVKSPWSGQQTLNVIINDSDQVAAQIYFPDPDLVGYPGNPQAPYTGMQNRNPCGAYFWSAGSFTEILDGDVHPRDINNLGQVVGSAHNYSGLGLAFVWDINTNSVQHFSIPGANPYEGSVALGINDDGYIVGTYKTVADGWAGPDHYFLATPVPQPPSIFMLVAGLIALIAFKRKCPE